jgi:hypothetical protein
MLIFQGNLFNNGQIVSYGVAQHGSLAAKSLDALASTEIFAL